MAVPNRPCLHRMEVLKRWKSRVRCVCNEKYERGGRGFERCNETGSTCVHVLIFITDCSLVQVPCFEKEIKCYRYHGRFWVAGIRELRKQKYEALAGVWNSDLSAVLQLSFRSLLERTDTMFAVLSFEVEMTVHFGGHERNEGAPQSQGLRRPLEDTYKPSVINTKLTEYYTSLCRKTFLFVCWGFW